LPIIGPEPRVPGLWYATGHGRNGILLSGVTGELVAGGIATGTVPEELEAFQPTRFWKW
jgi:glycine oxidase